MSKSEDFQKELENLVKEKFGSNIQVLSQAFGHNPNPKESPEQPEQNTKPTSNEDILNFDKKPKEVKAYLDQYVINQEEAKKTLSVAICDHYNQVKFFSNLAEEEKKNHPYAKQNVLLLGPTGVGKTYMVKQLAKLIGVPFVKADATKYSETGYMGSNVEDLIKDLVQQADDDIEKAEFGIIYIDEADKLAAQGSRHHGKDVNGRGVQLGLLKMMEETDVDLRAGNDPSAHIQQFMEMQSAGGKLPEKVVNTRNILFILSGAFTGLEKIIDKRLATNSIGFDSLGKSNKKNSDLLGKVTTEDLTEFGLEPEFVGRLPVRVTCKTLSPDDLFHILKNSKESILRQYEVAFEAYGVNVSFTDDALREIASRAYKENTGARSLLTIIESSLRDFKYHLPSTDITKLDVDKTLIEDPKSALDKILAKASDKKLKLTSEIRDFEEKYFERHGIRISFSEDAVDCIFHKLKAHSGNLTDFLDTILVGYEHGLKLILQNIGERELVISSDCITDPRAALEAWVKSSYSKPEIENETGSPSTLH